MGARFIIRGSPKKISREEARAMFCAADAVLGFHNATESSDSITVQFKKNLHSDRVKADGVCHFVTRFIQIDKRLDYKETLAAVVHEMIHLCFSESCEKKVSTLSAKIQPEVARIANILCKNTYKRAAYIAHMKISYRLKPGEKDDYNQDENRVQVGRSDGEKYRAKGAKRG